MMIIYSRLFVHFYLLIVKPGPVHVYTKLTSGEERKLAYNPLKASSKWDVIILDQLSGIIF